MKTNEIIRNFMAYIFSTVLPYIILFLFGGWIAGYLFLLGIFGLTAYVILDSQVWIKLNILIKYTIAICSGIIYRIYDINNYQIDTRKFEYYDQGFLVKHEPEVKMFRFVDFNDLFLIVFITTMMLMIYLIIKYLINKFFLNSK